MQPLPDRNTILSAVAGFLAAASKRTEEPGLGFKLKMASGLVAMAERELRLEATHRQQEQQRLVDFLGVTGEVEELNSRLVQKIKSEELDYRSTLALVKQNLKAELAVIQPRFDTEL